MKKVKLIGAVLILVTFFLNTSCQKETLCDSCSKTNKPPVAVAGADQVITLPLDSAILNGQGSSDPDGSIRHWRWNKIAGPAGATLQQPDSSRTRVAHLSAGIHQYELTVTDDKGLAAKDTVRVFVDAVSTSNHPPVAVAGADQVITLPNNTITLNGSSSSDPDNNITSYLWTKISGPVSFNIQQPTNVQTIVEQLSVGVYKFQLKVTDPGGLTASDTMQVTVSPAINNPPVANAGADQVITLPVNMAVLNGQSSTDPENNIVEYSWRQVAGPAQSSIINPTQVNCEVNNLVQGLYQFELKVTDQGGLFSKDSIKIAVGALPTGNSAVFDNLFWLDACYLRIPNIYSFIPQGSNLNVEVKVYDYQGQPSAWILVRMQGSHLPADFGYYAIENGNLHVYSLHIDCAFDDAQSYSIKVNY